MIVAALLTSVGINVAISVAVLSLYSVLSKQPSNERVYMPRMVVEGRTGERAASPFYRLIPSLSWVIKAWQVPDDEFMRVAGFDAYVFMRIFVFSLRIFTIAAIVGLFILLPINYIGNQLSDIDFPDIPNQSLDLFTIANVQDGSKRLWVHFCAVYFITGATCVLLYMEYKGIARKRFEYLMSSPPQPQHFTVLVRGIPKNEQQTLSDTVGQYFSEYHSSSYLSHQMVYHTGKIQALMHESEALYKKLRHLKSTSRNQRKRQRVGFLGLFGEKADPVDIYTRKLEGIQESVRHGQSEIYQRRKELPAAFVSFRSRYTAAIASQILQSSNPLLWVTAPAPEPRDVYWPFLSASYIQLWISKFIVFVAAFLLTILFLFPVTFVQGLVQLAQLKKYFPFLKKVLSLKVVSDVVTGYLPSLILKMFLYIVPYIMMVFSAMQGSVSFSGKQKSACIKVLYFTIWNVFFATVLSGSALSGFETFLSNPKDIPRKLGIVVPGQATFFITYVLTAGWTGLSLEVARLFPLIEDFCSRHFTANNEDASSAPSFPYHRDIPEVLFFGLLGFTYCLLAPLILPFLLVYFFAGYIFYRNQMLKVYLPRFESAGMFWPTVHSCTIFSLILMQIIVMGILGTKHLAEASTGIVPIMIITLLFNDYCRRRFLPIFYQYPAEVLIKRDREDEKNPQIMASFLEDLSHAYRDPALQQVQYSLDENGDRVSLLSSSTI